MTVQIEKLATLLAENAINVEEFANCMGISVKEAGSLCNGTRKVSASLARQIEQTFSKPNRWLDNDLPDEGPHYDLFG
ncbi:helix-turn-helix transcriptional regulator [Reinekea sp.]|jgi:plasmid maintenance system antidote protein VapI|uniref:helix-turn-helix transcriptional regulator n=1 Tax=Reinekea sp. TaxID=1970455 RepID=UPI002A8003D7|nr:helix-turn-helix transcriptional regulator [Reinekea sp.]